MSIERDVINLDGVVDPTKLSDEQYEAYVTEVLARDPVVDRLNVKLPPEVHGEWVSNDPASITKKKMLGFEIDTKYAASSSLHNDGSGNPIVGDVIFMTISKNRFKVIEKARQKRYDEFHAVRRTPSGKKVTPEEAQFLADTTNHGMPGHHEGTIETVDVTKTN